MMLKSGDILPVSRPCEKEGGIEIKLLPLKECDNRLFLQQLQVFVARMKWQLKNLSSLLVMEHL